MRCCPGSEQFLKGDIRVSKDLDGLGCLGDLGWYCTRAFLWAFDYEPPKYVQAAPGEQCSVHIRLFIILHRMGFLTCMSE